MTEVELKKYHTMFTEAWRLFHRNANPVDDEEFWVSLTKDSRSFAEKFGDTKFANELVVTIMREIENIYKKEKKNNG